MLTARPLYSTCFEIPNGKAMPLPLDSSLGYYSVTHTSKGGQDDDDDTKGGRLPDPHDTADYEHIGQGKCRARKEKR
jgi:hypothetical protein